MSTRRKGLGPIRFAITVFSIGVCATMASESPVAPAFDALYKATTPNYTPQHSGSSSPGRDVMICIMPDKYAAAFQTYAAWKHRSGTFIKIVKFSDINASNTVASCSTAIKPYIQKAYSSWTYKPTYLLLVGDDGVFPTKTWTAPTEEAYLSTNATDEYFGEMNSANGYQPEIMVGRLPVKDTSQMSNMLQEMMQYERQPYTDNTAWFKRGVALSDNEVNMGDSTLQTETVRASSKIQMAAGFTVDTLICTKQFKGDVNTIIASINKGCSWINYRGQGWSDGWHSGCYEFTVNNLSQVQNGKMLAFITGIGCGICMFNTTGGGMIWSSTECFAEEWLRLGSASAQRGACAVIGPTGNTHSLWNNDINHGIYVGMFQNGLVTPGQALLAGLANMCNDTKLNKDTTQYLCRLYCILGDPSIHPWKDVPQTATVTGPSAIPSGTSNQTVTVKIGSQPVQNAQVCISGELTDSVTYASGFTDANGSVTLSITVSSASSSLWLVARGGTIIPVEKQITVGASGTVADPVNGSTSLSLKAGCRNCASAITIAYSVPKAGPTNISIYSLKGTLVRTFVSSVQSAGFHSIVWDGRNDQARAVSPGMYLISLRQASSVVEQRVTKAE